MSAALPERMLAVQLDGPGAALIAREVPVPRPGRGEVLVRIAASPINPSDLNNLAGGYGGQRSFPLIPGYEASGTVVAAGPGLLPRLWLGRRVAAAAPASGGGAWAEYMVTPAARCFPLGRNVSLEQGAMSLVNPLTALAFLEIARRGRHAGIVSTAAASALGKMILRLGQRRGVEVVNVVRRPEQVEALRGLGAAHVVDSSAPGFRDALRALAHQLQATLVLDAIGGEMTSWLVEAAPPRSTILLYGNLSKETGSIDPRSLILAGKRLEGFYLPNWLAQQSLLQTLADMRTVQRLKGAALESKVQRRFRLSEVQDAMAAYGRDMTAGKLLLVADADAVPLGRPG